MTETKAPVAHRDSPYFGLDYYDELGRRGFAMAAEHRLAHEHGLGRLMSMAAERFVVLRVALNRVSDALFFPHRS